MASERMANIWLHVRVSEQEKREVRVSAAAAGLTMSDYVRLAVSEKMARTTRAARDNRHPNVPIGTEGTSPVQCGECGRQEVRTAWELDNHGKCRAASYCPRCLMDGTPRERSDSVRTT